MRPVPPPIEGHAPAPRTVQALAALFIGVATLGAVVALAWHAVIGADGAEAVINTLGLIATTGMGLLGGALVFRDRDVP